MFFRGMLDYEILSNRKEALRKISTSFEYLFFYTCQSLIYHLLPVQMLQGINMQITAVNEKV